MSGTFPINSGKNCNFVSIVSVCIPLIVHFSRINVLCVSKLIISEVAEVKGDSICGQNIHATVHYTLIVLPCKNQLSLTVCQT